MWNRTNLIKRTVIAVIILILCLVPFITHNTYYIHILIMILIGVILALSLRLVMNVGEVSFCHGAMMAIGAYASAILSTKIGISFWLCLPLAAIVAAIIGLLLGVLVLRLKGVYFFLITFAFGEAVLLIMKLWRGLTGGPQGIYSIKQPEMISAPSAYYYLALGLGILTLFVMYRFDTSAYGRCFKAIRENEDLAGSTGMNTMAYKVIAFTTACFFAGLAGSYYAHYIRSIAPYVFDFHRSLEIIVYTVVGGAGSILGPLIGPAILGTLSEVFHAFESFSLLAFGLLLVITVLIVPGGIVDLPQLIKRIIKK